MREPKFINAEQFVAKYGDWYTEEGTECGFIGPVKYLVEQMPAADVVEVVRCKDCKWGRKVCGNIECFVDRNIPPEYHGYEWFCPNGERRTDE